MTYVLAIIGYIVCALMIIGVALIVGMALLCAWLLGASVNADDDAPTIDPFTHGSGTP